MPVSYPFDFLDGFPGWSPRFEIYRRQETSRSASGRTTVKDIGDPLWLATYQSVELSINDLDRWRARLDALEEGMQTFNGRPLSRCYPIAYPNGTGVPTSGVAVSFVATDNKRCTISGLPAGYVFKTGDMIRIPDSGLYRLVEDRTATGDGVAALVEVRPHFWPGIAAGSGVELIRPWCPMAIVPGSISTEAAPATGRGTISFQAMEAR